MIVDYCGLKIAYTEFIIQSYKWALFDEHENFVGLIEHQEYINHPTLYTIGNSYGRYRKSNPSLCGGSFGNSNNPVSSGANISFTINPGTGTLIPLGTLIPPSVNPSGWVTIPSITRDDTPIEDAGIRAGEIIAHRCWWLFPDNRLFSVYVKDYEWMPGVSATGDVKRDGVHAFKYECDVYAYSAESQFFNKTSFIVFGTVKLWGEIVEHEWGYRAEFAKIASLNTDDIYLKHRYGVLD